MSTTIQEQKNKDLDKLKEYIIIKNETKEITKEQEVEYYDTILEAIEKIYTSNNYNITDLDYGKEEVIKTKKLIIRLTTLENQKKNINDNMTRIDLDECELLLRKDNNLTKNDSLYLKIIEVFQEGMRIPKVEYDIYSRLSGLNLIKLDKSIYQNSKVSLFIYMVINDNFDKLNYTSGYYNDICYTTTSDSGTDISIKDRQNECVNNIACEDDCDFVGYNYTTQKSECSCKVKESSSSFVNMTINATKLFDNLINMKNILNFNFLVCLGSLFSKEGLLKNIGFYIFNIIILYQIIITKLFFLKYFDLLKNKIKEINKAKELMKLINNKKIEELITKENNLIKNNEQLNYINNEINISNNNNKKIVSIKKRKKVKKKRYKSNSKPNKTNNNNEMDKNDDLIENKNKINSITALNNNKNNKRNAYDNIIKENNSISKTEDKIEIENIKKIMEYNDDEKNAFSYEFALKLDKRTYIQYYISLLRTKHDLLFAFYYDNNYNSKIIKMDLLFIGFSIEYIINALFYNDNTMHHIYKKKGSFDLEYQLPKSIYSFFISLILNMLLKQLSFSCDTIIKFKQNKNKNNINERSESLIKKLRIKFILYFIISFIYLIFFWYYISMFGAIYRNTQYHLIKDTLISFGLSMLYPFGIYLLPGLFRIPALADPKKKKLYLYKFSKLLQLL